MIVRATVTVYILYLCSKSKSQGTFPVDQSQDVGSCPLRFVKPVSKILT